MAIFPEGTTTDGSQLLHFHAALLQPAIACGHPVQTLALQYLTPAGHFTRAPAYDGDLSLGQCIANIIAARRTIARITVAAPIATADGLDRRALAARAHAEIACAIGVTDVAADSGQEDAATSMTAAPRLGRNERMNAVPVCSPAPNPAPGTPRRPRCGSR